MELKNNHLHLSSLSHVFSSPLLVLLSTRSGFQLCSPVSTGEFLKLPIFKSSSWWHPKPTKSEGQKLEIRYGELQSMESLRVRHDWAAKHIALFKDPQGFPWWLSGKNPPEMPETQVWSLGQEDPLKKEIVFLPGKSHGQRSLAGYNPWGRKS